MKNFIDKHDLFKYLAEMRIICAEEWNPTGTGCFHWYFFPDYDENEEVFEKQGNFWENPKPCSDDVPLFPSVLGFDCIGNIIFMKNFTIGKAPSTPVAVFDAFDENNVPCTFAMFGEGSTSIRKADDRYKLIEWIFEGFDDDDEMTWGYNIVA